MLCCSACEVQLEGSGPWQLLPGGGEDIDILFTPGHTPGCISMLYKPQRVCASCCETEMCASLTPAVAALCECDEAVVACMAGTIHRRPLAVLRTTGASKHCQVNSESCAEARRGHACLLHVAPIADHHSTHIPDFASGDSTGIRCQGSWSPSRVYCSTISCTSSPAMGGSFTLTPWMTARGECMSC